MILAVDPGTTESALVAFDGAIRDMARLDNEAMLRRMRAGQIASGVMPQILAIEMVASYGMAVGREIFETVLWTGRFIEAWGGPFELVYRRDVKIYLCSSARAKDGNIRQALIDRFGGTREAAIGVKKKKGPLYGVSGDLWAALAVAVTQHDRAERMRVAVEEAPGR